MKFSIKRSTGISKSIDQLLDIRCGRSFWFVVSRSVGETIAG